jgi:2-polyprenyl-3-methyl-5-hydroxy-6-metoxy-1,4-benzoquinol methylase
VEYGVFQGKTQDMTEQANSLETHRADLFESGSRTASISRETPGIAAEHRITYLSASMPVSMGDWWFEIATSDHFWIRRRFEVLRQLADSVVRSSRRVAEIGCGNGLLQRDIEDYYGISVAGFELNELALQKNVSRLSPLYCYNIHQRNPEFRAKFDLLLLFDVLEHIEDESGFLQSVQFHLAESGILLINVPAHQFFFSDYDRAAGHIRRYSMDQLAKVAELNGLRARAFTYWGLPLVPLLLLRKAMSMQRSDGKAGFDSRGHAMNTLLSFLARCEPLPQRFLGTSVMAVLENHA